MHKAKLQEGHEHKQKGWEHLCTVLVLVAEYGAVKYSIIWLAWTAGLFLWFAVRNYARHYLGMHWAKVVAVAAIPIIIAGTYYMTREKKSAVQAQTISMPSQPSSIAPTPQPHPTLDTSPKNKPKHESKPRPQDNSVHFGNGAEVDQKSQGACSPNIVGGNNTVTCPPPAAPPEVPVNSVFENGGTADGVSISGAQVTAPPNGRAMVVRGFPGSKIDHLTIRDPVVSSPGVGSTHIKKGAQLGIKSGGGINRAFFEDNTSCDTEEAVQNNGGTVKNLVVRNDKHVYCEWIDFLGMLTADRTKMEGLFVWWNQQSEQMWVSLSEEEKLKNRNELNSIEDQLRNAPTDAVQFSNVIQEMEKSPPHFALPAPEPSPYTQ